MELPNKIILIIVVILVFVLIGAFAVYRTGKQVIEPVRVSEPTAAEPTIMGIEPVLAGIGYDKSEAEAIKNDAWDKANTLMTEAGATCRDTADRADKIITTCETLGSNAYDKTSDACNKLKLELAKSKSLCDQDFVNRKNKF